MGQTLEQFEASTQGKSMLTGPNGIPGQCVGYMRLYIDQVLDLPQPSGKRGAKDQYLQYDSDQVLKKNFKKVDQNGILLPGDIVFWDANPNNPYGHVAICTAPSNVGQPFSVVEQNVIKNTVGERANIPRTKKNFLGALRPKDAIPGQKISQRSLGLLRGAAGGLMSKINKMLGENMIDEFIDYSENFISLKERQETNNMNARLLQLSKETGIEVSQLLCECVPYIARDNLDHLYEEIKLFQIYEKKLNEKVMGYTQDGHELDDGQEEIVPEQKIAQESHGRQKTKLKNEVLSKLRDYLQTKPVPDKRQVERVKNEILKLLGQTPAASLQQQAAPPTQQQINPAAQKNQYNLVNIVQQSVPYGFFGGSNDKLRNKVTEIVLNEYNAGDISIESLIQKVKAGIGRPNPDLFNSLRLNLNQAAAKGKVRLTN